MSITSFIAIFALVVLLFIAAELYVIAREISRGFSFMLKERESREGQSAGPAAGQTINVNLSPGQSGAVVGTAPAAPLMQTADISRISLPSASDDYPENSFKAAPEAEKKSVQSGQFALKCSRCQAENSSYRHECFNCGGPL